MHWRGIDMNAVGSKKKGRASTHHGAPHKCIVEIAAGCKRHRTLCYIDCLHSVPRSSILAVWLRTSDFPFSVLVSLSIKGR